MPAPIAPAPPAVSVTEDAVYQLAQQVHDLTGTPLLSPADYAALFAALVEQLNTQGPSDDLYSMAEQLQYQGAARPRDAVFIVRGLQLAGHRFVVGEESVQGLAEAFLGSVLYRCRTRANLHLTESEQALLKQWLLGGPGAVTTRGSRAATAGATDHRERCMEKVRLAVIGKAQGMELSELGAMIRAELPGLYRPGSIQSRWGGQPTLTKMLLSFGLGPLMIVPIDDRLSIIYDPAEQEAMDLSTVVAPLLQAAGIPLLDSAGYGRLFSSLYALTSCHDTLPSLDFLAERLGAELDRERIQEDEIQKILNVLMEFGDEMLRYKGNPASLARYFATRVLNRCRQRWQPGNRELVSIYHWITSRCGVLMVDLRAAAVR